MKAKPSECRKQAWAAREANLHGASFIERRLFYLNYRHLRHCEVGVLPNEAISTTVCGIASGTLALENKYALAVTIQMGMQ